MELTRGLPNPLDAPRISLNWGKSLGLSLLAHASLILLFVAYWAVFPSIRSAFEQTRKPKSTVWVDLAPPAPRTEARPPQARIVQTEKRQKADRAAPDAFLGEQTQTVDRQTVSKNQRIQAGQGRRSESQPRTVPPEATTPTLSQLGVSFAKPLAIPTRKPTAPEPQWAQGNPGSLGPSDYIKGMKEGEQTALNTREFVFYGYFQRIRTSLDRAWNKTLRENLERFFRRGRRLASDLDYTTRTLVTLNQGGKVTKVQVLEESGTHDLDDAAVRAFNEAGPFPNPPRGLVDSEGKVVIRWDFVLRN
jgi:TonB family protein